jgi:hypothetical protein
MAWPKAQACPGTGATRGRAILDRISRRQDGTAAAANTANRKRAVLNSLMRYAIEVKVGALHANPLKAVKWTRPRTLKTVDPRTVVNSDQARRLLAAVGQQGQRGERLVAFFGCIYYAALSTTPRCGQRKLWTCAATISSACPTRDGAS